MALTSSRRPSSRSNHTAHERARQVGEPVPDRIYCGYLRAAGIEFEPLRRYTMWKVLAVGNGQEMAAKRPHSLTQFGFHEPMRGVLREGPAFEN
jgi:hypothetical protein